MHLAIREEFGSFDEVADVHPAFSRHPDTRFAAEKSVYGSNRRGPNWIAIALILLVHAGGLMLLATLGVIAAPKIKHDPMVVTLIPELAPPPPPPSKPKPIPAVQPPPTV